jgi:hypothetical protein
MINFPFPPPPPPPPPHPHPHPHFPIAHRLSKRSSLRTQRSLPTGLDLSYTIHEPPTKFSPIGLGLAYTEKNLSNPPVSILTGSP